MKRAFTYRGEPVSLVAFAVCIFVSLGGFIFGEREKVLGLPNLGRTVR